MDVCSGRKGCRLLVGKRPAEKVVMVGLVGQLNAGHVRRWSTLTDVDAAWNVLHLETATTRCHNEITDRQCRIPRISSTASAHRSCAIHDRHFVESFCSRRSRFDSRTPHLKVVALTSYAVTYGLKFANCYNSVSIHLRSRITDRLLIASSLISAADLWQKPAILRNVANT